MRLAIFRPGKLLDRSVEYCESMGMEVSAAPSIDLYPDRRRIEELLRDIRSRDPDVIILTSQNSTELMEEAVGEEIVEEFRERTVAAIGTKTLKSLEERDVDVDVVPDTYSSAGLVEALRPYEGSLAFVARSNRGNDELFEAREYMELEEYQVYEVGLPRDLEPVREVHDEAVRGEIDAFAFTSTMTVKNFLEVAEEDGRRDEVVEAVRSSHVAALGRPTEETLESLGIEVDVVPGEFTFEGLVDAVAEETAEV